MDTPEAGVCGVIEKKYIHTNSLWKCAVNLLSAILKCLPPLYMCTIVGVQAPVINAFMV